MINSAVSVSALAIATTLLCAAPAVAENTRTSGPIAPPTPEDVRLVSPALGRHFEERIMGELWDRPGLSRRDRGIATVAALIARNQGVELPRYVGIALDSGVRPEEVSEIVTHLAFYSGLPNAMAAVVVIKDVFAARGIAADRLPKALPTLLPLDRVEDDKRVAFVAQQFDTVSPQLLRDTTDVLFRDLWLRPDLAPRDRSLVTVSALIAAGQTAQITPHLNKAMDNGLTRTEAAELVAHLSFYSGWPNAFSALPVMKAVFDARKS